MATKNLRNRPVAADILATKDWFNNILLTSFSELLNV